MDIASEESQQNPLRAEEWLIKSRKWIIDGPFSHLSLSLYIQNISLSAWIRPRSKVSKISSQICNSIVSSNFTSFILNHSIHFNSPLLRMFQVSRIFLAMLYVTHVAWYDFKTRYVIEKFTRTDEPACKLLKGNRHDFHNIRGLFIPWQRMAHKKSRLTRESLVHSTSYIYTRTHNIHALMRSHTHRSKKIEMNGDEREIHGSTALKRNSGLNRPDYGVTGSLFMANAE